MICPHEEIITESELSEIVKSYNTQISKRIIYIDELLIRNEGLTAKLKISTTQINELQRSNFELNDKNKELNEELVKLRGTLQLYNPRTTCEFLDSIQAENLKKRAGNFKLIEEQVLYL